MSAQAMIERARVIRARLMTPPNGRDSSELEVVSEIVAQRRAAATAIQTRKERREARWNDMLADYRKGFVHNYPQAIAFEQAPVSATEFGEPPLIDGETVYPVTVRDIARAVCRYFQISMIDVVSSRRAIAIVRPRHIIMYLARQMTTRSLPEIGRLLGGKDHTTVLHGHWKISELVKTDEHLTAQIEDIRRMVNEGER